MNSIQAEVIDIPNSTSAAITDVFTRSAHSAVVFPALILGSIARGRGSPPPPFTDLVRKRLKQVGTPLNSINSVTDKASSVEILFLRPTRFPSFPQFLRSSALAGFWPAALQRPWPTDVSRSAPAQSPLPLTVFKVRRRQIDVQGCKLSLNFTIPIIF
jgi:hypothetical protein